MTLPRGATSVGARDSEADLTHIFLMSSKILSTSAVFFLVASSSCTSKRQTASIRQSRATTHLLALLPRLGSPDNLLVRVPLDILLSVRPDLPDRLPRLLAQRLRISDELVSLVIVRLRYRDAELGVAFRKRGEAQGRGVDGVRDELDELRGKRGSGIVHKRIQENEAHRGFVAVHDQLLAVLDRDSRELVQRPPSFGRVNANIVEQGCGGEGKTSVAPTQRNEQTYTA